MITFGYKLAEARDACGITQAELAELSGIPRTTICGLEVCRYNPTWNHAMKLAAALKVSLDSLAEIPRSYKHKSRGRPKQ